MDDVKPKADNPLHKAAKGSLIGQFGVEGSGFRARASQLVVGAVRQHAWLLGLSRHPIPGDRGLMG